MRDQTKLIFNMGAEFIGTGFRMGVIAEATRLCGGCYVHQGTGFWNANDETHAEAFGPPVEEATLVVEVTCEPHKVERVYQAMQTRIARLAQLTFTDINWVHVSEIPMKGRHFSVKTINGIEEAA